MFDKRISKYLVKIECGEAINFAKFLALLPENLQDEVRNHARVKRQKGGLSVVTLSCDEIKTKLAQLTIEPKNRVEATTQGNSHKVTTSTSFLLAYHEKSSSIHPETVIMSKTGTHCLFKPKSQALIVENAELFFAKTQLFAQLKRIFGLQISLETTDLIYGSGNQVTHNLNKNFLSEYQSVLCFFDYDLGGLKIFKALKNMLGNKVTFLEPTSDTMKRYFKKKPANKTQYLKALAQAKALNLMALHSLLLSETAFMEQEAILAFD
ncbi:DUF2220 family protein [Colwellia sp. MSW7]|uniref:DUF2220 family protein n=1 Tax=Colwellia maritima TaxID=2912588 RepID=A0ABS9WXI6_9GAMM|nr:Wadjet anti-phage system protein JetD domain-containing protein [Colwellia maritima]MCI2282708.1 DUF2220 family protein [Colwellia maritima]